MYVQAYLALVLSSSFNAASAYISDKHQVLADDIHLSRYLCSTHWWAKEYLKQCNDPLKHNSRPDLFLLMGFAVLE